MKQRTIAVRAHQRKKAGKSQVFIAKTKQLMREVYRVRVAAPARRREA
jgi:hypothetical protein